MTDRDDLIRQAREMLAGTTEGPWRTFNGTDVFPDDGDNEGVRQIADFMVSGSDIEGRERFANARFIAWCREGVPALIAELEKRNG